MNFQPYPFERLNTLLKDTKPKANLKELILTIGEPQFETPSFISESFAQNSALLNKYPKIAGEQILTDAQIDFMKRRFGVENKRTELITTMGTREALFTLPQFLLFNKIDPVIAYPNPFYQIYEGAALASRAKSIYLNLTEENSFKPEIDEKVLSKCDMVILNSPSNPTASVMSMEESEEWVKMSQKHNFILINDECYSEIYFKLPSPPSLLNASIRVGNENFNNILVLNSISKRSCAPGLRSGFVAGDEKLLQGYAKYRTYAGCAASLPSQIASAKAWQDDKHVETTQKKYLENFKLAKDILGVSIPEATFYVWFEVSDDEIFTKELYRQKSVKVLPGSYLGRNGVGKKYVRIALVSNYDDTREALLRIADFIQTEDK